MFNLKMKKGFVLFAVLVLFSTTATSAFADTSATEIIGDFAVVRTTSFASMIVGAGVFVVTLPFTLIGRNVGEAGTKLVANPARATFSRPLGDRDTIERWPFKYDYQGNK